MTDPYQGLDEIMRIAANSMDLSVPSAQMFLRVGAELSRLRNELEAHREATGNQYKRHENQVADLRREIERLKGVHGA